MKTVLLAIVVMLAACEGKAPPQQVSPQEFSVAVHWYETKSAMNTAHVGQVEVDGFAVMTTNPGGIAGYRCDIHLVYPSDIGTSQQQLIGHEFAHCVFGKYHP